jgi:RNA-directed DNA polymerase
MGLLRRFLDQVLGRSTPPPAPAPHSPPSDGVKKAEESSHVESTSDGDDARASHHVWDVLQHVDGRKAAPAQEHALRREPSAEAAPRIDGAAADVASPEATATLDEVRTVPESDATQSGERRPRPAGSARLKLREQRMAETAERRRIRSDEIASRRASDIMFLGRGVSGRLGDRTSHIDSLASAGLPILSTPAELAEALGLSIPNLRWLAYHTEVAQRIHYIQFSIPKRSGGTRILSTPHRMLATAQRWVFDNILMRLSAESAAHGFLPARSIVTNARPHSGRLVVINLDLETFFPTIGFARVRRVFQRLGYSPAVSTILALVCTECPRREVTYRGTRYFVATGPRGLPQGACTSPGLSNQVARRLDRRLTGLATKLEATYTRYADDLTFSGDEALHGKLGYLLARVRHIARDEGFQVNETKTRIQRRNRPQLVTGLVVNDRPGVVRAEVRRLRAILHRAAFDGLEAQNREQRPNYLAWLEGKIAFVAMARPEVGKRLKDELRRLRDSV